LGKAALPEESGAATLFLSDLGRESQTPSSGATLPTRPFVPITILPWKKKEEWARKFDKKV